MSVADYNHPRINFTEQVVNFSPTTPPFTLNFSDEVGDTVVIELLNVTVSGAQALDVGLPFSLRVGAFNQESFKGYKFPQFSTMPVSNGQPQFLSNPVNALTNQATISGTQDIPLPFTDSPSFHLDFDHPPVLMHYKRSMSHNLLFSPSIVSTLDGITVPFYDCCTLRLRFHQAKDSFQLAPNNAAYLKLITSKLPAY